MMQQLGLSAAEAAACFQQQPAAANPLDFRPAITTLAPVLAGSGRKGESGEQLLGELLRRQPRAVTLAQYGKNALDERINYLQQVGISHAQLATALKKSWGLLARTPEHLAQLEEVAAGAGC